MRAPTAIALNKRLERRGMLMRPVVMSGPWDPPDPKWAPRMTAFDQLPPALQEALRGSTFDLNAEEVLKRFRQRGEDATLAWVRESERRLRDPGSGLSFGWSIGRIK